MVRTPTPGLYEAVLQVLGAANSWTQPAASPMAELVAHLSAAEAESLPLALADVLPLLRGDRARLRFAAEIAARLDLFEAAEAVLALATSLEDHQLLLNAADLSSNPAADPPVAQRILEQARSDRPIRIRLDATAVPQGADEERLYEQYWPGARAHRARFPLPPVAVFDTSLRADVLLRLAVAADRAGAAVRRLDPGAEVPFWFGAETVLVCAEATRRRVRSRYGYFPEAQIVVPEGNELPQDRLAEARLRRRVDAALGRRLLTLPVEDAQDLPVSLWSPDVFGAGVYSTREAGFLSGAKASSLSYLHKRGVLQPHITGALRWRFSDVVAVRTWAYLKAITPGRVSSKVVGALAAFEGSGDAVRLGVTTDGRVMADLGKGFEDVLTGQMALDLPVTDVDSAFRPFEVGGGSVPDLLHLSPNSTLLPTVLNGTPHLSGHRIAAKDLGSLDRAGGAPAIADAYPELEDVQLEDVVTLGHQLLELG